MKSTLIYAHRGASADAPENTLGAFKKALDFKSDGIEFDVQMTKDGHLVVLHDDFIDRTSDGSGSVNALTLQELKCFSFGSWFSDNFIEEKIPTLDEVMMLCLDWDGIINIEIKSRRQGVEKAVIDLVSKYNKTEKVIVSSFDHYTLVNLKKIDPSFKTGALFMERLFEPWDYAKRIGASAIHPHYAAVTPEVIQKCVENKVDVNIFTVDRTEDMLFYARHGVSGIITNVPDIALKTISYN